MAAWYRLTAAAVKAAKNPGILMDGGGLRLRVAADGSKKWIFRATIQGKTSDIGLGSFRDVSLAEARDQAEELRKVAKAGGNPLVAKRATNATLPTFSEAALLVHEQRKAGWRNGKHQNQWISTLTTYAFPVIGHLPVNEVTTGDCLQVLGPIWIDKGETARRVLQRIIAVIEYAVAANYRTDVLSANVIRRGLPQQKRRVRHHAAIPYSDVSAFIDDLRSGSSNPTVKLAFEFQILTAARTGETLGAVWQEINLDGALWTIPARRMKAGVRHRVPLSCRCIEILETVRELHPDSRHIFPGRKKLDRETSSPLSNMAFEMAMRRLDRKETPHGFRSTFRDWAAEQTNHPHEVVEAALAHVVKSKTERAYKRSDLFDRRQLMDEWAACLKGSTP